MTTQQQALYDNMTVALDGLASNARPDWTETSFWLAVQHWEELKRSVDLKLFADKKRAIAFFKHTKPFFTGRIQFYTLVAEVLMFIPSLRVEQENYWRRELERLPRFMVRNDGFVKYLDSGATHLDEKYFLPVAEGWVPTDKQFYYDADPKFCSPNDHQVRGLLAHRLYHEFVKGRLKGLGLAEE